MAISVEQARQERQIARQAFEESTTEAHEYLHGEKSWKTYAHRDGKPALAAAGIFVALSSATILAAKAKKHSKSKSATIDYSDITHQLERIQREVNYRNRGKGQRETFGRTEPFWQKVAIRAVGAGATAAGSYLARRFMAKAKADKTNHRSDSA